jgi:hypothetical protein
VGPTGQPLHRPVSHLDWPSWAALPIATCASIKASPQQRRSEPLPCPSTALPPVVRSYVPPPLFELTAVPVGKCRCASFSPKPTTMPHSLPLSRRVLRAMLPCLTPPLPVRRSSCRAGAERHRHTPSTTAPLVVYDLLVLATLPRVGTAPHRATYISSAVGRAVPPPRDAALSCHAGTRAMRSGRLACWAATPEQ